MCGIIGFISTLDGRVLIGYQFSREVFSSEGFATKSKSKV